MQHLDADREMHDTLLAIIKKLPLEDRIRFVDVDEYPVEERLRGLTFEQRLRGLTAEDVVRGLTPKELDCLRKLLQQPRNDQDNNERMRHRPRSSSI